MKKFKAMMKKLFSSKATTRVLSAFLSAVLLFYVIPTVVYGEVAGLFESEPSEESSSGTSYEYINEMHEVESLREESVKHFRLEDGSYVAAQYNYPVHYADEDGKWQDIDNTLESAIGGVYATSNARIKLAKKITGNETLFALKDGNTKLSFGLIGAAKGTVGTVINGEDSSSDTELQKMMNLEKLSSSVVYENILPGVDLEYVIDSLNIKENLIVKEKGNSYSYSFSMKLNGMYAELDEDGNVLIYNDDSGEIEYTIPAPVVFDSASAHAPKGVAIYTLEADGKKYTLTVTVDASWMNSEDRVYPVTVDPTVSREKLYIDDTYITNIEGQKDTTYGSANVIAISTNSIAYLLWKTLPDIPDNAYISNATVKTTVSSANGGYIGAYEVLTYWDEALTWNLHTNGTNYNRGELGDLIDYNEVYSGDYYWNITSLVRDWWNYANDGTGKNNYGIAFNVLDGFTASASFCSSENSNASVRPTLEISYTVMRGVEDYWSYSSHSAGVAGSGSINLANGKLTFAIPTLSTTDSLMPYTPTLIYDSSLANVTYSYSDAQCAFSSWQIGYGFKLNIAESITKRSYVNSLGTTVTYYVYADADGTEHAMLQSTGDSSQFIDEDGLRLVLTVNSDNTLSITDDSKTIRTFSKTSSNPFGTSGGWYLSKITDKVGNSVIFSFNNYYRPASVSIKPNGSDQIDFLELLYNSSGVLNVIQNKVAKQAVVLKYSDTHNGAISSSAYKYLRRIDFVHFSFLPTSSEWSSFASSTSSTTNITIDSTALYTYDSSGLLLTATDSKANQKISYEWNAKKVSKISHYGGSTLGQSLSLTYGVNHTAVRTVGENGIENDSDDIITRSAFDNFGRVKSSYSTSADGDTVYGATTGEYSTENSSKNSLTQSTVLGGTSVNYLKNGNFKDTELYCGEVVPMHWTIHGAVVKHDSINPDVSYVESTNGYINQSVYLDAGTYTFSIPKYTAYPPKNCSLRVFIFYYGYEDMVTVALDDTIEPMSGEGIYSKTFTVETSSSVTVELMFYGTSSDAIRVYNVSLDKQVGISDVTLVENGGFEYFTPYNSSNSVDSWNSYPSTDSTGIVTSDNAEFNRVLSINSSGIDASQYVKQNIFTSNCDTGGVTNRVFGISGFAMASDALPATNSIFRLRVDVAYYQGKKKQDNENQNNESQGEEIETVIKSYYFNFDPSIKEWQFIGGSFSLNYIPEEGDTNKYSEVVSIDVYCEYSYQLDNSIAYFDNIYIYEIEDDTVNYEYYTNSSLGGLMKSMTKKTYSETYEYYENRDLKKVTGSNGTTTEYTYYGNTHLPKSVIEDKKLRNDDTNVTTRSIIRTYYIYNSYGLCTSVETRPLNSDRSFVSDAKPICNTFDYNTTSGSKIFGALISEFDGIKTTIRYTYDQNNGNLLASINYQDQTGYCYSYDGMGRLTGVRPATYNSSSGYTEILNAENVTYDYNANGYLESITTASTTYNFSYNAFGNSSSIKVGSTQIASYEYYNNNGNLKKIIYGNGHEEEYKYNELDLLTEVWYNQGTSTELVYSYEYTSDGQLYKFTNHTTNESIVYKYDLSNRIIGIIEYLDTDIEGKVNHTYHYDDNGRVSMSTYYTRYASSSSSEIGYVSLGYHYNADDSINYVSFGGGDFLGTENFELDYYDRISSRTYEFLAEDTGTQYTIFDGEINYTYVENGTTTNAQVATYSSTVNGTNTTYTYTYDNKGNITKIRYTNGQEIRYYYDDIGQLIREDNTLLNATYVYNYDNAGNITSKKTYILTAENSTPSTLSSTKSYTYGNTNWKDLLTAYNGVSLTYDTIGNPLSYYNGTSYTFGWNGRRLVSATTGSNSLSFTYNDSGIRTSKTKNGVTTTYYLSGSQIIAEETNGNFTVYIYDADGSILGFQYRGADYFQNTWDTYFFEKNLQGDVVAIYDEDCNKLVSYTYDAWGNFTRTYTNGGQNTVAANNPFTYRGYYFDYDLKFYYLNSRYYDPYIGRFINADSLIAGNAGSLHGYNLFAYCFNNPVNLADSEGNWPTLDGLRQGVSNISHKVIEAVVEKVEEIKDKIAETDFIYGTGIEVSFTYNHISYSQKIMYVKDSSGESDILLTSTAQLSTADYGLSITNPHMISNASNINELKGYSKETNLSTSINKAGVPFIVLGGGVGESNANSNIHTYTASWGIGTPGTSLAGGEAYTRSLFDMWGK